MNVQNEYHQLVRSRGIHRQVDVIIADQRAPGQMCVCLIGANKFASRLPSRCDWRGTIETLRYKLFGDSAVSSGPCSGSDK
jgi:hypothetical protein